MYRKTVLSNGVRVVTERMVGVRSLTIGVIIEVGSKHESRKLNGIAHCIEHLLFKGTTGRDAATLARMIDLAGGQLGAFTTRDYTCLFAAVLDDYRTYALDIFGDILLHSLLDAESLRREQEAIFQEQEAGEERPEKLVQEILKQAVWHDHPLGQSIYGQRSSVARITKDDVLTFFRDYYGADRIIISAAGNVEHDDFVAQVNDALWALPQSGQAKATEKLAVPEFQPAVEIRKRDSAHVYFTLGAPASSYASPERYAVYVLNNLLGSGMSSRLYQQMRDQQGWVYEIGSVYHPYREAGLMLVEGFTTPRNLLPVLRGTVDVLISLLSEPVNEEELWRAKERLRGEILIGAEASNTRMSQLATQELYFGRYIPVEELVNSIRAVTPEDIIEVAGEMFQPGNLAITAVGPLSESSSQIAELIGL